MGPHHIDRPDPIGYNKPDLLVELNKGDRACLIFDVAYPFDTRGEIKVRRGRKLKITEV